jgi:hypothetical protein
MLSVPVQEISLPLGGVIRVMSRLNSTSGKKSDSADLHGLLGAFRSTNATVGSTG